ncbi:hypothetical protein VTK73DRAFT_9627 [Phialemonium thermophilum]|uniref:Cupin 2 conserved barrel domain-containing protein n=1 Tax=Phialemonium thermophilum TaxID=223376 RepID=A0ABR3XJQ2_9PEZI
MVFLTFVLRACGPFSRLRHMPTGHVIRHLSYNRIYGNYLHTANLETISGLLHSHPGLPAHQRRSFQNTRSSVMATSGDKTHESTKLPDPKRYITHNNSDGKAVFSNAVSDSVPVVRDLGGALTRLAYITARPPVSLTDGVDVEAYTRALSEIPPLVPPGGGAVVWYIDTPPGASSPLHRTVSFDIVVQLQGEMELTLDSGESRLVRPGDVTLQRSTMHMWRNPSHDKWSRMIAVMSESQPVVVGGRTLDAEFPQH